MSKSPAGGKQKKHASGRTCDKGRNFRSGRNYGLRKIQPDIMKNLE